MIHSLGATALVLTSSQSYRNSKVRKSVASPIQKCGDHNHLWHLALLIKGASISTFSYKTGTIDQLKAIEAIRGLR
jgi:hypothetical protein